MLSNIVAIVIIVGLVAFIAFMLVSIVRRVREIVKSKKKTESDVQALDELVDDSETNKEVK